MFWWIDGLQTPPSAHGKWPAMVIRPKTAEAKNARLNTKTIKKNTKSPAFIDAPVQFHLDNTI